MLLIPFQRFEGCLSGEVKLFHDNYYIPKKLQLKYARGRRKNVIKGPRRAATNQLLITAPLPSHVQPRYCEACGLDILEVQIV